MSENKKNCERARESLALFIDGQLPSGETLFIQSHLSQCGECQSELQSLRNSWDLLFSVKPTDLPAGFEARFWAKARQTETSSTWIDQFLTWPRLATAMAGFAALWVMSIGVGASLFFQRSAFSSSPQLIAMLNPTQTSLSDAYIKRVSNSSRRSSL
jgi:anti-sigma factor RsiW